MTAEKIQRVSRVVYVLLKIAFVAYIVFGGFQIVTMVCLPMKIPTEGFFPLISWRGTMVLVPMLPYASMKEAAQELIQTVCTVIALGFGARTFRVLREANSPFRPEVTAALKRLAIALLFTGLAAGAAGFLAAGIAWVLYMAFGYGCALQNESDTTL